MIVDFVAQRHRVGWHTTLLGLVSKRYLDLSLSTYCLVHSSPFVIFW